MAEIDLMLVTRPLTKTMEIQEKRLSILERVNQK